MDRIFSSLSSGPSLTDWSGSDDGKTNTTASPEATAEPAAEPSSSAAPSVADKKSLKVLFLSSDTGGGHRASATSLAQQFENLFPGSTYELCDIVQLDGPPPYNMLVKSYKHLSAHPHQWKLVYSVSNTRAYEMLADVHMKSAMERAVRKRIMEKAPDVVVSVHPLMTNVPVLACSNITKETGKHLPIFTVCTDLGSAHSMWFANGVEKLFVASEAIKSLAMQRGKVPEEKIVMSGLPIRYDFSIQATNMGERHCEGGREYQRKVRTELGLEEYKERKCVLVMGGGEGCGRLSNIVDGLYLQFVERNIEALILVVCGRNEELKESLEHRNWEELREKYVIARNRGADLDSCIGLLSDAGCIGGTPGDGGVAGQLKRIISSPSFGLGSLTGTTPNDVFSPSKGSDAGGAPYEATSLPGTRSTSPTANVTQEERGVYHMSSLLNNLDYSKSEDDKNTTTEENTLPAVVAATESNNSSEYETKVLNEAVITASNSLVEHHVKVMGLGFITNMAEYMVAADVLVSKAGPGTIAEAASLSLPVMLTSFLPGQEEGNVDYVVQGEFGTFVSDSDPQGISDVVASWLTDEQKLKHLSANAKKCGAPDAAAEIVEAIGESALRWKNINDSKHAKS
eukprot:scaffold547_cov143-Skeletonema_menzelii.AAC.19